jgi:hypothetical protein
MLGALEVKAVQRHTVVAEIFGYLVCLFAVFVFFLSVRGVVNGVFGVIHPTPHTQVMIRSGMMGPGRPGNMFFWRGHDAKGARVFGSNPGPDALPAPPPGANVTAMRTRAMGDARYEAARGLVVAIVMLIVSILVFRNAFDWLNRSTA